MSSLKTVSTRPNISARSSTAALSGTDRETMSVLSGEPRSNAVVFDRSFIASDSVHFHWDHLRLPNVFSTDYFAARVLTLNNDRLLGQLLRSDLFVPVRFDAILRSLYPGIATSILPEGIDWKFNAPVLMATVKPEPPQIEDLLNTTDRDSTERLYLARQMSDAFAAATLEEFERGIESTLSRALADLIEGYGDAAVEVLGTLLTSEAANLEAVGEALRTVGQMQHEASKKQRFELLQQYLRSHSPRTRYAAALGLAAMNDPSVAATLVCAHDREDDPTLRRYLERVLEQV